MKRKMRNISVLLIVLAMSLQTACSKPVNSIDNTISDSAAPTISAIPTEVPVTEPAAEPTSVPSEQQSDTTPASNSDNKNDLSIKPYVDIRAVFKEKKVFKENDGSNVINPIAFIDAVKKTKE